MTTRQSRIHKWIRRALLMGVGLLLLVVILATLLQKRAGPEYYGVPETLLPQDAGGMMVWRDFSDFVDRFKSLNAIGKFLENEDAATMLFTGSTWTKWQEQKDKAHVKLLTRMAGDFVNRWFGREVTLALLPPDAASGDLFGGLLLIARSEVGFEENLAELIAQNFPELSLEEMEYRGVRLYRYNASKNRHAFSYCRFGSTVLVSIRSGEWHWLQSAVDRKIGESSTGEKVVSLGDNVFFIESASHRLQGEGLTCFLQPENFLTAFRSFPSDAAESISWQFWFDFAREGLNTTDWGALNLTLDDGLSLRAFWRTSERLGAVDPGDSVAKEKIIALTSTAAAFLYFESTRLGPWLRDLYAKMKNSEAYAESMNRFDEDWLRIAGAPLDKDYLASLDRSFGAALTGVTSAILFPVPIMQGWWQCAQADEAKDLVRARVKANGGGPASVLTQGGVLAFSSEGNLLEAGLNESLTADQVTSATSPVDHPLVREAFSAARAQPVFCLFINFEVMYDHLVQIQRVKEVSALWSPETRQEVEQWKIILGAVRYLHALSMTAREEKGGMSVELVISVD